MDSINYPKKEKRMKNASLRSISLIICVIFILSSCNFFKKDDQNDLEDDLGIRILQISDSDFGNLIVYEESSGNSVTSFGEKGYNGLTELEGIVAQSRNDHYYIVYKGSNGKPSKMITDDGYTITFKNYSFDTVDVEVETPEGSTYLEESVPISQTRDIPSDTNSRDLEFVDELHKMFTLASIASCTATVVFAIIQAYPIAVTTGVSCGATIIGALNSASEKPNEFIEDATYVTNIATINANSIISAGSAVTSTIQKVEDWVNEGSLIGEWDVTEASNSTWYMDISLMEDDTFYATEYIDYSPGSFYGTWDYVSSTEYFTLQVTGGGSMEGVISGDTSSFSVDGYWASGDSAYFYWDRDE